MRHAEIEALKAELRASEDAMTDRLFGKAADAIDRLQWRLKDAMADVRRCRNGSQGDSMTREIAPFGVRMPPELKSRIEDAAAKNGRSLNSETVARLQDSFDKPARPGMIKVEFDCWEIAQQGSSFVLEMQTVPRVGDGVLIHKNLIPPLYEQEKYLRFGHPGSGSDDDYAYVVILRVEHEIGPAGHLIRVDFEDEDHPHAKEAIAR